MDLSKQDSDENLFLHLMIKYRNLEVSSENVCTSTFSFSLILSLIRYGNLLDNILRSVGDNLIRFQQTQLNEKQEKVMMW